MKFIKNLKAGFVAFLLLFSAAFEAAVHQPLHIHIISGFKRISIDSQPDVETNDYLLKKIVSMVMLLNQMDSTSNTYDLVSPSVNEVSSVVFEPIDLERFGTNNFTSLRFILRENRISVDKIPLDQNATTTEPYNDVPFQLTSKTNYNIRMVIENSMVVFYINDQVALSSRIYKVPGNYWGLFAEKSKVIISDLSVSTP